LLNRRFSEFGGILIAVMKYEPFKEITGENLLEADIRMYLRDGPKSVRGVICKFTAGIPMSSPAFARTIHLILECPETWRIDVGDENGVMGLLEHPKPGDGSVEASAKFLGLAWLDLGDGSGTWMPRPPKPTS
jgi:hypothetical protein